MIRFIDAKLFVKISVVWFTVYSTVNSVPTQCKINGEIYRHGQARVELRGDSTLYSCTCFITKSGARLQCNTSREDAQMLVADTNKIQKFLLKNGDGYKKNFIQGLHGVAVSVGADYNKDYVFWTDVSSKERGINRASLSHIGRITKIVSKDVFEPNGLAVDWLSKNIYWTDAQLGAIFVSNYDGDNRVRLIGGLSEPRGIELLPFEGIMFWSDQTKGTIERAWMDGSEPTTIVQHLVWPNEVVADRVQRRIYWIDGFTKSIESCGFDGSARKTVINYEISFKYPAFGLSLFDGRLYFGVWNKSSIYSVTTVGSGLSSSVSGIGKNPMGIYIVNKKEQELRLSADSNLCWTAQRHCSHLCLPTSFNEHRCACPSNTGLVIAADGQTCVHPEEFLLYTSLDDGTVMLVSMMQHASRVPTVLAQSYQPSAVDFDPIEKMVYWSDVATNKIYRKAMNESDLEIFLEGGIGTVDGLCVDWLNRHLYFTNIGAEIGNAPFHRIEMVDLADPYKRKIIASSGFEKPRDLVINPHNGDLYVSDWGTDPKVVRLDLDGQNPVKLDVAVENPNGLAYNNQYLYITDSMRKSSIVQSNGTIIYRNSPKLIRYDVILEQSEEMEMDPVEMELPFGLTMSSNKVYLTDWELGGIYEHEVGSGRATEFIVGIRRPTGLKYATINTPNNLVSACTGGNNCSDICVSSDEQDYMCLCSDESGTVQSESNNWNCVPPESFILVADGNRIMMKSLIPDDNRQEYAVVQTFDQLSDIVAVTYDPLTSYIYWADNGRQRINRKAMDGKGPESIETMYRNIGQVDGMTIDPVHRLLYWTDVIKGTIEVMHLRTRRHATVLDQLDKPRAIVLTPDTGKMYWTEWGDSPMLAGAKMSGQDFQPLLADDLQWPNGIFFDKGSQKMFLADGGTVSIQTANDGRLDYIPLIGSAQHLYGLGKIERSDSLVFSDWGNRTVMKISKYNSVFDMRTDVLMENMVKPSQIHVQNSFNYPGPSGPCQPRIHQCSHICIPDQYEYVCLCPDHLVLANDMRSCVTEEKAAMLTSTHAPTTTAMPTINATSAPWAVKITSATTTTTQLPTTSTLITVAALVENSTVATNTSTSTTTSTTTQATTTVSTTTIPTTLPPNPTFVNCDPKALSNPQLAPNQTHVLVSPDLLGLKAVDGNRNPINVTVVDTEEKPIEFVKVDAGKHIVHFHAYDGFGQKAVCVVALQVTDRTPPTRISCPSDITVETYSGKSVYVNWEIPKFQDNSGLQLNVTSNHKPGRFISGIYDIEYVAVDQHGNYETCNFVLAVIESTTECGYPKIPENSQLSCTTDQADGIQKCLVMCDKGYRLTLSDPFIKCTHNKLSTLMEWLPYLDESACQKPSVGNVVQELDLLYPCPCKPTSDYYDSRRRSFTSALRTHSGCRRRKERLGFCNQSKNKLFLECIDDVKLKVRVTVDLDEIKTIASTKEARLIVEKGAKEIVEMVVTKKITAKGSDSKEYPADNSTALSQALVICEEGWLMDDQGCSKCPKGTFMSNGKCEFCPVDSYQDQSGKTFCHKCPPNKQTATYGSMNVYYCKLRPVTGEGSMNKIIIGGVIGGFVFLLAILLIIGFIHRRRKNNQMKKEQERKRRQRLARERRKKKKKADKADSEEASGARSETETNTEQANGQIPNNESATAVAAIQTQATKKRKPPPSETSTQNNEADDATSVAPSDIVTQTDATSTKSIDDDTKSAGAESAIFTDGGASDTMSVVSSEMPLKSALKKRSKPPPSYLEDDQTTIISASTISVGRVRQMQKRPVSLDEDRNTKYSSDSMRRGRGAGRSMSMRRPESVSPNRFRPEGPQSLPVQGMPMKRSMSMERGPNPGYDPRLLPHHNPAPMMVRPPGGPGTMPPGGPNMMGQPPRRRGPMYPTYAPRGMHPPGNLPYQAGKMRNPYMTLQPGARPPRGAYWNPAFDGSPNDWEGMAMRNDAKMRPPPQMMTMPRNMGARYRMPNGMMPNGGHGNIPPHLRHRMPSPPPYYA